MQARHGVGDMMHDADVYSLFIGVDVLTPLREADHYQLPLNVVGSTRLTHPISIQPGTTFTCLFNCVIDPCSL
ncbi:unnamed protein product [Toxocara canis]|uniref:DUF433 domain-containing protein n=1 Tax=Toxocara canis TaxID=6265 RepID=A0A183UYX2_TOXCA|nr:unnamed protein product [Toxocara canis]